MKQIKKELLNLSILQYNSKVWKNKCSTTYKQYRFMVDCQEYYLWNKYSVKTKLTTKEELQMKINNLGLIFHLPFSRYHLQNNGLLFFSSDFTKQPLPIGNVILDDFEMKCIHFPSKRNLNTIFSTNDPENVQYVQMLMNVLKSFPK